jgi:hypothetical protein
LPHVHILFWTDCDTYDIQEIDKIINSRYPRRSRVETEENMIKDYRTLIDRDQIHNHTARCRMQGGQCRYGYPQRVTEETRIEDHQFFFAHREGDESVVPHNPQIFPLPDAIIVSELFFLTNVSVTF